MSKAKNMMLALALGTRAVRGMRKTTKPVHRTQNLMLAMTLGAGMMWLFDPDEGRRRRALIRDKITAMSNDLQDTVQSKSRHLRNKAVGAVAETRGKVEDIQESVSSRSGGSTRIGA